MSKLDAVRLASLSLEQIHSTRKRLKRRFDGGYRPITAICRRLYAGRERCWRSISTTRCGAGRAEMVVLEGNEFAAQGYLPRARHFVRAKEAELVRA